MIRWMCDVSIKDRRTSEELRELVGVEHITTVIKSGRLRWYKHVMRKSDEDWVKKVWSIELDSEDRLEDKQGHGYRVWERIWQNLRSTEKMPMAGRNRESML